MKVVVVVGYLLAHLGLDTEYTQCNVMLYSVDRETVDVVALSNNIRIIAESIAQQIYNVTEATMPQLFTNGLV